MKTRAIAVLALLASLGAAPVLAQDSGMSGGEAADTPEATGSYCEIVAARARDVSEVLSLCQAAEAEAEEAVAYEIADYPDSVARACREYAEAAGGSHVAMDGCLGAWLDSQPEQ